MSDSRGAKIFLKQNINSQRPSVGLENVLSIILGLENNDSKWKPVANSGKKFNDLDELRNIAVAKNSITFNRNLKKGYLTHKTLGAIICYVFEKFDNPQLINNKLYQLFQLIKVEEGKSYNASVNTLTKHHINQRNVQDQKELRKDENYSPKYPQDWKFEIDINWKPLFSIYPRPNNQEEIKAFMTEVYTLNVDDDSKPKKFQLLRLLKNPIVNIPLVIIITILCNRYFSSKNSKPMEENVNNLITQEGDMESKRNDTIPVKIHTEYNGIKNEFNGNVENVNFTEKKEKMEL